MLGTPQFSVIARGDGSNASIKVVAVCSYGSRTASIDAEIADKKLRKEFSDLVTRIVDSQKERLTPLAIEAAVECLQVAIKKGEKL